MSRPFPQKVERSGPASPWRWRHGRWRAPTQEKKSGDWDDQSSDRELFKGLSRDRVLRRWVTGPRGSQAPNVHRQHVRPWRKSRVAFHVPLVGPAEFFDSLGNAPETYHRRFANILIVNGPQYYYCSSRIQPDDTDTCGLYCLYYFKRRHRGMELTDIMKDFSTVDLKGNEDKILRSNC